MAKRTNKQYISELKQKKPSIIPLESYKGVLVKIKHQCLVCNYGSKGEWEVTPNQLLNSSCGCPHCGHRRQGQRRMKGSQYYRQKVQKLVGNEYTIDSEQIDTKHKIVITHNHCIDGGKFTYKVNITKFIQGRRCPKCARYLRKIHKTYDNKKVDQLILDILGNTYIRIDNYKDDHTKMRIKHKKCNHIIYLSLRQIVDKHIGCYFCHNNSRGEALILEILESLGIKYEYQKTFSGCIDKRMLPFDFYLPDYNLCIEYDGVQHYKNKSLFYSKTGVIHDKIKDSFCEKAGIKLIRIPYRINTYKDIKTYIVKIINNSSDDTILYH